jgi:hypothetical protein
MSRQEMRAYGKQEFGQYPLITMEPRPERLTDYYKVLSHKIKMDRKFVSRNSYYSIDVLPKIVFG